MTGESFYITWVFYQDSLYNSILTKKFNIPNTALTTELCSLTVKSVKADFQ